ncbi:hypothetical protein EPO15_16820 [bacterium]|nr:MAG: hypothetical protein EPO15_16820 [bacterium]
MTTKRTLLTIVALASPLLLFLWEQVQATRLGYEVSKTQTEVKRAQARLDYLRLELERLGAPESVAAAARRRLGMSAPLPESVVVLGAARIAPPPPAAVAVAAPVEAEAPPLLAARPGPER